MMIIIVYNTVHLSAELLYTFLYQMILNLGERDLLLLNHILAHCIKTGVQWLSGQVDSVIDSDNIHT